MAPSTEDWILNSNPGARFHFKTFLVPVPFPLVTTFKTTGTYKKWQWPNSTHITYAWHALLLWHTYLHTAPAQICTPLIVSRSLASNLGFRSIEVVSENVPLKRGGSSIYKMKASTDNTNLGKSIIGLKLIQQTTFLCEIQPSYMYLVVACLTC